MNELKCNNIEQVTSKITSFSHAYMFEVDSLQNALPYILNFSKRILCPNKFINECNHKDCNICYLIDHNMFDDLYILDPNTINIKSEEIDKMMNYFETTSLRLNGKRLYIICGFERLSNDISNKILKFLEEPVDNLYAILLTEHIENILPTIISRCQVFHFKTDERDYDIADVNNMKLFLNEIKNKGFSTIAYGLQYWQNSLNDRSYFLLLFEILEKIFVNEMNRRYQLEYDDNYQCLPLCDQSDNQVLNILSITSNLKNLVKKNINLNLLLDRYIIEISKEWHNAESSRSNF